MILTTSCLQHSLGCHQAGAYAALDVQLRGGGQHLSLRLSA